MSYNIEKEKQFADMQSVNLTEKKLFIEAWQKIVDVQMHFNLICINIRGLAIAIITGYIFCIGYFFKGKSPEDIKIFFENSPDLLIGVSVLAALAWISFWIMDIHWYHQLLRSAVKHGMSIEKQYKKTFDGCTLIGIALEISKPENNFLGVKALFWFYPLGFFIILLPMAYIIGILGFIFLVLLITIFMCCIKIVTLSNKLKNIKMRHLSRK